MIPIRDEQIGGAVVRRRINRGDATPLFPGAHLSREEVLAMPTANRQALVRAEHLWLEPKVVDSVGERHIVHLGRGQYDVIEGKKLNAAPLSKDEAEDLATRPTQLV